MNKVIHHKDDFEGMRKAGHLAASTLDMLVDVVKPGITTEEIDNKAFEFIDKKPNYIYIIRVIGDHYETKSKNIKKNKRN